jgi:predicted RNase H-like nuclease (RuvC/YqgF family)
MGKQGADDDLKQKLAEMQDMLSMQKNKFDRTLGILQNRIEVLEKEVAEMKSEFERMSEKYSRIKDKEVVEQSREPYLTEKTDLQWTNLLIETMSHHQMSKLGIYSI